MGELPLLTLYATKLNEPRRLRLDVGDVDVEVHPVLGLFRLGDALEQELWTRFTAGREEEDVAARAADQVVAQRRRPEGRQLLRVVAVEDEAEMCDHGNQPATGRSCMQLGQARGAETSHAADPSQIPSGPLWGRRAPRTASMARRSVSASTSSRRSLAVPVPCQKSTASVAFSPRQIDSATSLTSTS